MQDYDSISIEEAQKFYSKSRSRLYDLMSDGTIKFHKVNGVREILVSAKEYEYFKQKNKQDSDQDSNIITGILINKKQDSCNSENNTVGKNETKEIIDTFLNKIDNLYSDIRILGRESGQMKLLEDSENRTKQEYLRLVQENAVLKAELDKFKEENRRLKDQLDQERNKPFWKKKVL